MHLPRLLLLTLPLVRTSRPPLPCHCGHTSVAHEHYRSGRDCALCACVRYRVQLPSLRRSPLREHSHVA